MRGKLEWYFASQFLPKEAVHQLERMWGRKAPIRELLRKYEPDLKRQNMNSKFMTKALITSYRMGETQVGFYARIGRLKPRFGSLQWCFQFCWEFEPVDPEPSTRWPEDESCGDIDCPIGNCFCNPSGGD